VGGGCGLPVLLLPVLGQPVLHTGAADHEQWRRLRRGHLLQALAGLGQVPGFQTIEHHGLAGPRHGHHLLGHRA
jgi:hypothetical protein